MLNAGRAMIRLIKNNEDYAAAMARINALYDAEPAPNTPESDELEVLSVLISDYEERHVEKPRVDALTAIEFRMEQLSLQPRDLIPYLGSRSRVSEVLSGKRQLSVGMIRALHRGLGIPLSSLLGDHDPSDLEETQIPWDRFPVREMIARGWLSGGASLRTEHASSVVATKRAKELLEPFFAPLGGPSAIAALYRKSEHVRSARSMDAYALAAWSARILIDAQRVAGEFCSNATDLREDDIRALVQLSVHSDGPLRAVEFLRRYGVFVSVQPHLPRTYLDGAAMLAANGMRVIGLTLRHDRLDNFWFTLFHELAHITQHLGTAVGSQSTDPAALFYDDLEFGADPDPREEEADALAGEWLVPKSAWEQSAARYVKSPEAVEQLASQLKISPAIVAGKVRHFFKDYRVVNNLVGHDAVRRFFPAVRW
jgi:HTH-type transcriptional regulator/antitoxin HigA